MISAELVRALRERTGAGIMDCKLALQETGGDLDQAVVKLREKGLAQAARKAGRTTAEGSISAYVHGGGRIAVLVELNCETDFVARTEEFRALGHEIALQVAAARPRYVRREDVPDEVLEAERQVYRAQALSEGKPEAVVERIVAGRLEKFLGEACLLEQPYIRDADRSVADLVGEYVGKIGENIRIGRFCRYEVGESPAGA